MNLFTALKHDFSVYVTKKIWIKWQTNIAHFDRKPFQYRSLTQVMKMHNNWRENLLFGDCVDLVNSDSCNLLSKLSFLESFRPFQTAIWDFSIQFHRFHFERLHPHLFPSLLPLLRFCSNVPLGICDHGGNQRSYYDNRKWHSILPSFQRTLYSRKKLEDKTFPTASRWNCEDIYPADYVF